MRKSREITENRNSNGSAALLLIVGIVVLILIAGAYYYLTNILQKSNSPANYTSPITSGQSTDPKSEFSGELNSIEISDDSSDFSQVDEDLKQL